VNLEYSKYQWEMMYPQDALEEIRRTGIVYFPFGCVEEHGTHNVMIVDFLPVHRLALRTAEEVPGLVYPPLLVAPAGSPPKTREQMREASLYPPSVFLSVECCRQVYEEMLENFAGMGFKCCVAIGGHGPAIGLMGEIAAELGGKINGMDIIGYSWPRAKGRKEAFPYALGHGEALESSFGWAMHPDAANPERIHEVHTRNVTSQLAHWSEADLTQFAAEMSPELGQRLLDFLVNDLAETVREWQQRR